MEMATPLRLVLPLACGVETRPAARCPWWWRAAKEAATAMAILGPEVLRSRSSYLIRFSSRTAGVEQEMAPVLYGLSATPN
jgi:hypothetical protein